MKLFKKILGKLFGFTLLTTLLLNVALTPVIVKAQEVSPTPSEAPATTPIPSATPEPSPVATPTPSDTAAPTPDPSANPSATPEPSATPSPSATPAPSATPQPSTTPTPTPSNNNVSQVVVGTTYNLGGQNVKVKFNSVTDTSGNLNYSENTLSPSQITQLGALSNTVYDISSSMPNGSFAYDLTLPYPTGVSGTDFKVLYASDINSLSSGTQVSQSITDNEDGTFTIHNLTHFTVFVVVNPNTPANCDAIQVGTTCYTTIQAAVNAAANDDTIKVGSTGSPYGETVYVNKQLTFTGVGNPSVTAFVLQTTPVTITGITTSVSIATPIVSLTNPVNSGNQTTTTITGTGAANATLNYTITGTSGSVSNTYAIPSTGVISITNINVSTLPDGPLTLTVNLTSEGYSSSNATAAAFKDTGVPTQATGLTITNPISNSNKTAVAISGTVEVGSTVNWTISNGGSSVSGTTTLTSGGTFSATNIDVSSLPDGTLTLSVTVTDAAGNTSATASTTATKDTVAPTVSAGTNKTKNVSFNQDATVSDPSPSSGGLTYLWTKQSGPGTITFGSANAEDTIVSASQDGTYVLLLTVNDAAGNSSGSTFTLVWDTQAPTVNAGSNVSKKTLFNTASTVSDPSPSSGGLVYSWTKLSGPGTITFGTASTQNTTITASQDGAYVIRLTVTDAAGNSAFSEFTLNWDTVAPTVNAGTDKTKNILYAQDAAVTDPTPSSDGLVYQWIQISGPGTITFGSATSEDTSISASQDGTYVVQLTVTDAAGNSASDTFSLVWDTVAPTVNAGSNVSKNALFTTSSTVSDPSPSSGGLTYLWTKQSGPGNITFGTSTAQDTTITADQDGTYVIQLMVTDAAGNSTTSTFTLVWDTVVPTVNAGSNTSKKALFTTTATASDPSPSSGIASYLWTQVSGPGTITFGTSDALNTTITTSQDGAYVIRLTVTDIAGNTNNSQFILNWDTVAPTVDAGANQIKNATFTQTGTASDAAPSSGGLTYVWSKVSGPGTVTFGSVNNLATTISTNADGNYVIRLTVTDAAGNFTSSNFTLTWDVTVPTGSWNTPASGSTVSGNVTLNAAAQDANGIALVEFAYKRNDGVDTFHITGNIWDTNALALDSYTLRITITDNAGNVTIIDQNVDVATVIPSGSVTTSSVTAGGVIISWTTDDPTSSRVIYDTVSHSSLGPVPNYGYAFSTNTQNVTIKVLNHLITLTGLNPSTKYFYRVISAGSPEAVSAEFSFTTSPQPSGGGSGGGGGGGGSAVSCSGGKPVTPILLSAIVTGPNQITLNWSKALDPVTLYLITYGTKPGLQQYGNPNVGGPNTTTYTVGYLQPGVRYYFRVRAGNDCVPGDFSNEVSVVASGKLVSSKVAQGFSPGILGTKKTPANNKKIPAINNQSIKIPSYTPIFPKTNKQSSGLLDDVIQFFHKKLSLKLP